MATHRWDVDVKEATRIQQQLRKRVSLEPFKGQIKTVGGADLAYEKTGDTIYGSIVVLEYPAMKPLYAALIETKATFPYIPGLLSFREIPALMRAWDRLPARPDVLVLDGQGVAHPRRLGLAAHFGVLAGAPAMGCAKKRLCGAFTDPALPQGSATELTDELSGEQIGWVYRGAHKVRPVFVSPGHGLSMQQCLEIIRNCSGKYRIPEPTRQADILVNAFRRGEHAAGVLRF